MSCPERPRSRQRVEEGFSLIELLVAIVIVSFIALGAFEWLIGGLTRTARTSAHGAAVSWAQGEIDYMRRQCFEQLKPGDRKVTAETLQPGEPPLPPGLQAAYVKLEAESAAHFRASVFVYKEDWPGDVPPPDSLVLETTTFIGDVRVAGGCP